MIETVLGATPPPRAARPRAGADHNLLFGLLALQNNFIDRDTLVAAFAAWVTDKSRDLGRILLERGAVDAETARPDRGPGPQASPDARRRS